MNMIKNQQQTAFHSTRITNQLPQRLACGLVLLSAMLLGAVRGYAATNYWVAGSGTFSTAANWNPATAPVDGEDTVFTNDTSFTVSLSGDTPSLDSSIISNHAGTVTINPNGFTWLATNAFRVGINDCTTTVIVAGGGSLNVAAQVGTNGAQLRIADSTNLFNCVSMMIITNGTVGADAGIVGADTNSVGALIITDNGVYRDGGTGSASTLTVGNTANNCRLIVTNGGKLFVNGTLTVGNASTNVDTRSRSTNNLALFSGPTSAGTFTTAGTVRWAGDSGSLIVSNKATLFMAGSLLFGNASSYNTGVVVGAGTKVIVTGSTQIGTGSLGGTNNFFLVTDGGFLSTGGTFAYGNNAFHINDGVQIGGKGLMSTGLFTVVRSASNNTNHFGNFMTITNAFVNAWYVNPQGPGETVSVLDQGTLLVTNSFSIRGASDTNSINLNGAACTYLIDRGTIDCRAGNNNGGGLIMHIGPTGATEGNSLIVTNGGKLLTDSATLGADASFNTSIVVGVSSVWSNMGSRFVIGPGTFASNNYFAVVDNATFYNAGSFNIGNSATSSLNVVQIGGVGGPVTFTVGQTLRVGADNGANYNKLTIGANALLDCSTSNIVVGSEAGTLTGQNSGTNNVIEIRGGTVNVSSLHVRGTNSILFTAGTLNTGHTTVDNNANQVNGVGKPTVVGDGTSSATLVMVAGNDGTNDFNNGGLVITNNAFLRGNGVIGGNVTILGTLAPGLSIGSITCTANLVLSPSAVLAFELGSPNSDYVQVKGNLTLAGTVNVLSVPSAANYPILGYSNLVSSALNVGTVPGGFSATVSNDTVNSKILLAVSAVVTDPYASWATHYFPLGGPNAAGSADPDADGMSNTNEFLAGFSPTNGSAYVHIISAVRSGSDIIVTYRGANGDNTYAPGIASRTNVLEATTGTGNGSYATNGFASIQTSILSGGDGSGTNTSFTDVGGAVGATKYYRVRVLVP